MKSKKKLFILYTLNLVAITNNYICIIHTNSQWHLMMIGEYLITEKNNFVKKNKYLGQDFQFPHHTYQEAYDSNLQILLPYTIQKN